MTRHVARAVTGMAAVGITVAAAAVAAAATAGPPSSQQHASAQVTYTCAQPSGPQSSGAAQSSGALSVPVTAAATFPARMTADQPVQPGSARLTIHLPPDLVTSLTKEHATALGGTARLTLAVAQAKSQATASWTGLTWPAAALPASGGLTLTASGPVAAVQPRATGPLTFTLAGLTLALAPHARASGAASLQPTTLACTLPGGSKPLLATVAAAPASRKHKKARTAAHHKSPCPKQPKGGYKLNLRFKPPKLPKGIKVHRPVPVQGCAFAAGYADVRKLHGASRLGPVSVAVTVGIRVDYNFARSDYFQEDSAGVLDYRSCSRKGVCRIKHGLPPTQATFLAFGFMPATATMHLDEIGTLDLYGVGTTSSLKVNYSYAEMRLKISGVKINGIPLNVGPDCQAVRPLVIKLAGLANGPVPYSLQGGGPLQGKVNIPAFKGCGVGENLDPLFGTMRRGVLVGSISGPGNFTILTQGNICTPASHSGCPPRLPRPIH